MGGDSEIPQVKRSRVEQKKHFSGVESGVDASHEQLGGDSERVNKNHDVSGVQSEVDASCEKMGGDSEIPQVKRSRVEQKKHFSGVQSGIISSHGQIGEVSECHQVKKKRVQKAMDGSEGQMCRFSDVNILYDNVLFRCKGRTVISVERKYAEIALEFYGKRQDAEFGILEVLFSNRAKLVVPGYEGVGLWCHVSFRAKPMNAGCSDDAPKHFFGEMLFDRVKEEYNVTYCSIFEPSDPRNLEGCVFCPPHEVYLHPADGCPAGGRKSDKFTAQKGTDASQGQTGGCSKRHPPKRYIYRDDVDQKITDKAYESLHLKYAKIALEYYEKSKDAEFEIVEPLFSARKPVVVTGSNCNEEWWCHVTFTAKPKIVECSDVSPDYFFGELLRDSMTGKYNATYCETFKPTDRRITHGCIICPPLDKHPFVGFRVGLPRYSIAE